MAKIANKNMQAAISRMETFTGSNTSGFSKKIHASNGKELTLYVVKSYYSPMLAVVKETGEKIFAVESYDVNTDRHFRQMGFGTRQDVEMKGKNGRIHVVREIDEVIGYYTRKFSREFIEVINGIACRLEAEQLASEIKEAGAPGRKSTRL